MRPPDGADPRLTGGADLRQAGADLRQAGADLRQAGADLRQAGAGDLGRLFREARESKGLELGDVAELTHVRREYLRALEEGRFADLPEDVYTRNFVRLFAHAVGLPGDEALELYQRERQRAGGLTTLEERLEKERRGEPPPRQAKRRRNGRGFRINPMIPTVLLVVALVALAVWGYNALFFRPGSTLTQTPPAQTTPPTVAPPAAGLEAPLTGGAQPSAPVGGTVLIDILTEPAGAQVSVDGFMLPGVTPIRAAPVTARANRTLRVSLDGYQTLEQTVDLTQGGVLQFSLVAADAEPGAQSAATPVEAPSGNEVLITVRATSWLEVYRGTARNEGERLVYTTASPGAVYRFTLPVYVHAGNAAGVEVTVGDGAPTVMGSAGAVVGRAFSAR